MHFTIKFVEIISEQLSNKKIYLFVFLILQSIISFSQDDSSNFQKPKSENDNRKIKSVAAIHIGLYGGSMIGLYNSWYKNYDQTQFHVFNDDAEWMQMDKIGHVYSAYTMSRMSMELWKNTGINRKKRIWIGGLTGAAYQTIIETLDGFSSQWGWSWGDVGANILGSAALISQELIWNQQRFQIKTSFHKKSYEDEILNQEQADIDEAIRRSLEEN